MDTALRVELFEKHDGSADGSGWFHEAQIRVSPTASDGSGMVPSRLCALRLELVNCEKVTLRVSPMASDGSGVAPGRLRALRLELVYSEKITLRVSPTASDGSGKVPGWFRAFRLELVNSDKVTLREAMRARLGEIAPGLIRLGRVFS